MSKGRFENRSTTSRRNSIKQRNKDSEDDLMPHILESSRASEMDQRLKPYSSSGENTPEKEKTLDNVPEKVFTFRNASASRSKPQPKFKDDPQEDPKTKSQNSKDNSSPLLTKNRLEPESKILNEVTSVKRDLPQLPDSIHKPNSNDRSSFKGSPNSDHNSDLNNSPEISSRNKSPKKSSKAISETDSKTIDEQTDFTNENSSVLIEEQKRSSYFDDNTDSPSASSVREFKFLSAASGKSSTTPTHNCDTPPAYNNNSSGASTPINKCPWVFYGCSNVTSEYRMLDKLGEGTFGEVHKGEKQSNGLKVALKRIFLHNEKEGFPITALREIRILKNLDHPNIIPILDMAVQHGDRTRKQRGSVYMVTPYMDHDLAGLLGNPSVNLELPHIKCYMKQLLEGMKYLHDQQYLHRDIKSANILIDNWGNLRIADFGLARSYVEPHPVKGSGAGKGTRVYTSMVVTRWYRAPELVLGESKYTTSVDMWGVGCVFSEMFSRRPILPGTSDSDQAHCIFKLLGTPTQETMPGFDKLPGGQINFTYRRTLEQKFSDLDVPTISLLSNLLKLDPLKRITAVDALDHVFFRSDPKPCRPQDLPKYNDSHEMDARKSASEKKNRPEQRPPVPHPQHPEQPANFSPPSNSYHYNEYPPHQPQNNHTNRLPPYRNQEPYYDSDNSPRPLPPYKQTQNQDKRNTRNPRIPPYKQHAPLPYDGPGKPSRLVPPYRQQVQESPYESSNGYQRSQPPYKQHQHQHQHQHQKQPHAPYRQQPPLPPTASYDRPLPPYRKSQQLEYADSDRGGRKSRSHPQEKSPLYGNQGPNLTPRKRRPSLENTSFSGDETVSSAPHLPPKPHVEVPKPQKRNRPSLSGDEKNNHQDVKNSEESSREELHPNVQKPNDTENGENGN
ncbi:uncharacterized protein SAPINGB_P004852 [Magnusiomyces paraingens]|uniref:Serine/threonine-protein kinase BUR1 n=1 Tax=Magnusiomyces paraingens TaxID=2606893 RepID=A0A5E8C2G8_9ASCO|nr:uncharacterized protein SAPINGB_P004852 [Saprochaete ingens]VVT56141.1 unnamed protein product [Saprochaete ingens]